MSAIPSLLSAQEIKLAYGTQVLLNGVTMTVAPGEKLGLVRAQRVREDKSP
jgi:ATPase subunit of ABC transporter with duplicated ATPase domains